MTGILLTHTPPMREKYYGAEALAALRALAGVRLHEAAAPLDTAGLIAAAAGCAWIITDRMTPVPAPVFAALPDLRGVLRCAVDIRSIDVDAASAAGVLVTRASPGFVASVVELTLGFLVDLSRGISASTAAYRAGRPAEARMGRQLAGGTLGLIGYGSIGRALAPVAAGLGMRVLVADPHVTVDDPRIDQVGLATLLGAADYVVCLAVATEATENLMDAAAFARMRPDAYFLNLSRGELVDEAALAAALAEGRIAGAALDVGRAADQMPSPALAALAGVIATPHVGGLTPAAIAHQARDTVRQMTALLAGRVPEGAVNVAQWTRRDGSADGLPR